MRLVSFAPLNAPSGESYPRFGVWVEDQVIEIGESPRGTLESWLASDLAGYEAMQEMVMGLYAGDPPLLRGHLRRAFRQDAVRFFAPLKPRFLRDFYAFETHVRTANANRGRDVPAEWYDFPVFYFTYSGEMFGDGDSVPYPSYTQALDYELEIACVIGKAGRDLSPEQAEEHILGFTIFNDWSARDVQRQEMKVGLGPAKGKDFAKSLGPCILTLDELEDRRTQRHGVYDLSMAAYVNGVERSRGNLRDLYWSFGQMLARASEAVTLQVGDVIGSGTVGTGCLLETTRGEGPWLQRGDVVTLEIERIGRLTNRVG